MLSIRLKRIGKKHQASYRVVVSERRHKMVGIHTEDLGWYNPHTNKSEINKERTTYWMSVGAKPSMTIAQILKRANVAVPAGIKTSKTYAPKKTEEAKAPAAAK